MILCWLQSSSVTNSVKAITLGVFQPGKKREKIVETGENIDGSLIGPKMLRKRQEVSGCHADREDHDAEESMDFAETLPDSALS